MFATQLFYVRPFYLQSSIIVVYKFALIVRECKKNAKLNCTVYVDVYRNKSVKNWTRLGQPTCQIIYTC